MGKTRRLFAVFLSIGLLGGIFFVASRPALALDDLDQVCSTGVAGSTHEAFLSHEPGQTFSPSKKILTAVGVYVKTFIGNSADVTMRIVDAERTGATVATKTQSVTNQYSWVYFELGDISITPDTAYGILLTSSGNVQWKYTDGACYDHGYASWNGEGHPESDFGFATYGHDPGSQAAPPSGQSGSNGSSGGQSGAGSSSTSDPSQPQGVSSSDSSGSGSSSDADNQTSGKTTTATGSKTPNPDELKAEILKDHKNNEGIFGGSMFSPLLTSFLWPIVVIFVIFVFGLGALILILATRKKKNQNAPSGVAQRAEPAAPTTAMAAPAPPPAPLKPEPPKPEPAKEEPKPPKPQTEMKEAVKEDKHVAVKNPAASGGKKKHGLLIVIIIIIVLLILGLGGYFLVKKVKSWFGHSSSSSSSSSSSPAEDGEFKAALKPTKAEVDSDKARAVTKTVSSAGSVLQTQGVDGTLYTLTVPVDATILPAEMTMTPLTNVPLTGYKKKVVGGVALTGGFDLIRPAYLTIQPNQAKPTEKLGFNYCAPGSRGFSPEVCAGMAGIPFTFGVAPGKIVAFVSQSGEEDAQTFLDPTIYTGMKDTYTAQVLYPGAYFADNASKDDVEKFAQTTFALGADFVNKTEVLMHLATLGGKLDPYKSQISRFARDKTDYPREVLKSAILARAIGDKTTADKRTDDYYSTISRKSKNIRSSYVPIIRYAGTIRQIKYSAAKKHRFAQVKPGVAYALEDYNPSGNGGSENYDWPIPDYEGDNGTDYGEPWTPRTWQEMWNELFPPGTPADLREWSDVEAEAAAKKKADDELEKNCRDEINKENNTSCEKAQAVRTIMALGRMKGTDYDSFSKIVGDCAKKCTTMEECEDMGDMGDKWGNNTISMDARMRISDLLKSNQDCNLAKKKGLEDFGKNTCESDGSGSDLPEAPPPSTGPPSLDL